MIDYRKTEEGERRFSNPEIYKETLDFQKKMEAFGVAWHNHFSDECTSDFCCCQGDNMKDTNYKHYIPSFREAVKLAFEEVLTDLPQDMKKVAEIRFEKYLKQNF